MDEFQLGPIKKFQLCSGRIAKPCVWLCKRLVKARKKTAMLHTGHDFKISFTGDRFGNLNGTWKKRMKSSLVKLTCKRGLIINSSCKPEKEALRSQLCKGETNCHGTYVRNHELAHKKHSKEALKLSSKVI